MSRQSKWKLSTSVTAPRLAILSLACVASLSAAQIPPSVDKSTLGRPVRNPPDWLVEARVEGQPLEPGKCAYVAVKIHENWGTKKLVTRPNSQGQTIGPYDVNMETKGKGASSFRWLKNDPNNSNFQICATNTPGEDRATILISYPRAHLLSLGQVVPGIKFFAQLPVVRGSPSAGTPEYLPLTLEKKDTTGVAKATPPS